MKTAIPHQNKACCASGSWLQCALALTLALCSTLSGAVVGGASPDSPALRVDANSASSPWAGVGSVLASGGTFSGALVAPNYVLTAAHVVAGHTAADVRFQLNAGGPLQVGASEIFINPAYTGISSPVDGLMHGDLALVRLSAPVTGVTPYSLYASPVAPGQTIRFVGYGDSGDGVAGITVSANPAIKRVGSNRADRLLNGPGGEQEMYLFDFDGSVATLATTNFSGGPTLGNSIEATLGSGDSGSPTFVQDNDGTWRIAGVNTFVGSFAGGPTARGLFGTAGGGVLVSAHAQWIETIINAPVPPVPEASAWAMMLAGLAAVGFVARRHRP